MTQDEIDQIATTLAQLGAEGDEKAAALADGWLDTEAD
jgi:hypothetical protein